MRLRYVPVCLALLALSFGALGCSGATTDDSSEGAIGEETTSTAAPSTTTTLSDAQVTLSAMTLRQKAAQVLLLAFSGTSLSSETSALLAAGPPGGLIVLGYNVTDATQVRALTGALQRAAAAGGGSRVGLLVAVDQEGGDVRRIRQGVPDLPSARKLGTESTPTRASELARQTAHSLLDMGINMNFAPVADVVADKHSFLFDRSYGSDSALVTSFVTAVIQSSQGQGLISVVKHFPGHGSASGDTHKVAATSTATKQEFEAVHLPPFRAAISAGVEGVMISHVVASAYDAQNPASLSRAIVGGLLREDLGFEGLVVADDLFMAAALEHPQDTPKAKIAAEAKAAVAALNAGCDLLILTEREASSIAVLEAFLSAIERGEVSQSRLDDAVLKILELKFRYGIVAQQSTSPTTSASREETIR